MCKCFAINTTNKTRTDTWNNRWFTLLQTSIALTHRAITKEVLHMGECLFVMIASKYFNDTCGKVCRPDC